MIRVSYQTLLGKFKVQQKFNDYLQFRPIEVSALEEGHRHIKNPRLTGRKNEFSPALGQRACCPNFAFGIIRPGDLAFDYNPASTTGTYYTTQKTIIGLDVRGPTRTPLSVAVNDITHVIEKLERPQKWPDPPKEEK